MKLRHTLVWFVITAAFIGPGTVTTATAAGAAYGYRLLWTLLFALVACLVLQEGVARIRLVSGLSLGPAIRQQFGSGRLPLIIATVIVLGCAAYEAGNILGAVSGVTLMVRADPLWLTSAIVVVAAVLLATNRFGLLTHTLALIIGLMGLGLLVLVFALQPPAGAVLNGLLVPTLPAGSGLLALGLVGTTVVPYNLFLGARLAVNQQLSSMRLGLVAATVTGGLISLALILIGTRVTGEFSFAALIRVLAPATGSEGAFLFAFGLFAAGLTSAITAPWAAAVALTSTLPRPAPFVFHLTWAGVLFIGWLFGVSGLRPVPVIILAQVANGIILPFLGISLLFVLNNRQIMGRQANGTVANILLLLVIWITGLLGLLNVSKGIFLALGRPYPAGPGMLAMMGLGALLFTLLAAVRGIRLKSRT